MYLRAEITDELLTTNGAHSSTGLRSAEDEALDTLPDAEILTAMKALPEQFRLAVYWLFVIEGAGKRIRGVTSNLRHVRIGCGLAGPLVMRPSKHPH